MVDVTKVGTILSTDGVVKAMAEASKNTEEPMSQKDLKQALSLLKQVTYEALLAGQKVQITGFAAFMLSYRSARKGNNVTTGQPMDIPAGVTLNVKAGKTLKDAVQNIEPEVFSAIEKARNA